MRNPLIKRIPKELASDWHKYIVIILFMVGMIGVISGMYVGRESMVSSIEEDDHKIFMPVRSEFFGNPLYQWISHKTSSLPLELGSRDLLAVNVIMAYDTVS